MLIHNIHTGLNLNNLNLLEQNYLLTSDVKDINIIDDSNFKDNLHLIKEDDFNFNNKISSLYINNKIPFSF
jgi:hypothetical protein